MKRYQCTGIIMVMIMTLTGCSRFSQNEASPSVSVSGSEQTTEESVQESTEDDTETPTEVPTEELVSDLPVKEALLSTLWGKMLQYLDSSAPQTDQAGDWQRTYEAEILLRDFTLEETIYSVKCIYPKSQLMAFILYWPDYITDISEYYEEANNHLQPIFDGQADYVGNNSWIVQAREESVLQIVGQVTNEAYEQADKFLDNLYPYTYYKLWGSVMEVAGKIYQDSTGSILGDFVGRAYMMDFNFETLTGNFWICLEEAKPVMVTMTFTNQDCAVYTVQTNEEMVLTEEELKDAWLGLKFDLNTTQSAK